MLICPSVCQSCSLCHRLVSSRLLYRLVFCGLPAILSWTPTAMKRQARSKTSVAAPTASSIATMRWLRTPLGFLALAQFSGLERFWVEGLGLQRGQGFLGAIWRGCIWGPRSPSPDCSSSKLAGHVMTCLSMPKQGVWMGFTSIHVQSSVPKRSWSLAWSAKSAKGEAQSGPKALLSIK